MSRSRKALLVIAIPALVMAMPVRAATFEEYRSRLADHPAVMAYRADAEAAHHRAEGELGLPDPTLLLGLNNVPVRDPAFDRYLPTSKSIGLAQAIPFPGVLYARSEKQGEVSDRDQLRASYQLALLEADLITNLVERQRIMGVRALLKQQVTEYNDLDQVLSGVLASGRPVLARLTQIDVARTEIARIQNDLEQQLQEADAALIRLVGEVPNIPPPTLEFVAWDGNPRHLYPVLIADKEIAIADREVEIRRADYWPDLSLSAEYLQRESGQTFDGGDWFTVRAGVTLPIWSAFNQDPKLRAAHSARAAAKDRMDDTERVWRRQLAVLESARATAARNADLLEKNVATLREVAEAARRTYEAGGGSYQEVLDADIERLRLESNLVVEQARVVKLTAEYLSHIVRE